MVRLSFGSTEQPFDLLVDTGSSWTWVNTCAKDNFKGLPEIDENGIIKPTTSNECPVYYFD